MKQIISDQIYEGHADYGMYALKHNQIEFYEGRLNPEKLGNLKTLLDLQGNQSLCSISWNADGRIKTRRMNQLSHHGAGGIGLIFAGTVDNLDEMKEFLLSRGLMAEPCTEADVIARLISENLKSGDYSIRDSVSTALSLVEGDYAVVVMAAKDPCYSVTATRRNYAVVGEGLQKRNSA